MAIQSHSRTALHELIELLQEIDQHWCSEERNLSSAEEVAGSHRALMHILEAGLVGYFEQDARAPSFRRIVTPSRKLTGDNSDAIYFDAPLDSRFAYLIRGNMNQAVYFSMTIEGMMRWPMLVGLGTACPQRRNGSMRREEVPKVTSLPMLCRHHSKHMARKPPSM